MTYYLIDLADVSSLGTWEHPYIDIIFSEGITIDDQQEWYQKGTLDYNVSGTIEVIKPEISVSYEERTIYKDTPHFKITLNDDSGNKIDSISFSSRDIYSDTEYFNSKLKIEIPLEELNDELIEFKNNNPGQQIFTKTYNINLEVKLERIKWFSSTETKPILIKTADIIFNLNVDTDSIIVTAPELPNTDLKLKGIRSQHLRIISGDLDDIQFETFEDDYEMDWNIFYHVIFDAIVADSPSTILNQVYEIYKENDVEKTKEILEFKIEKNFELLQEPINITHAFRERGYWKWWKEYHMMGSPSLRIEPCGPYSKVFKWVIKIHRKDLPEDLLCPQKELAITIRVPENKIKNMWKALQDTEDADNITRIGVVIGVGIAATVVVIGLVQYVTAAAVAASFLGPLGWLALGVGLLVVGVIVAVATGLAATAKKASANRLTNKAMTDCSIEYDSNYDGIVNYLENLEQYEEIPNEIPIYLRTFLTSIRNVIEISEAIKISFPRYLSAVLDGKEGPILLQYENCERMMRILEEEVLKVVKNKDNTLLYVSEAPAEFDESLIHMIDGIINKTLDEEIKEKLKQIDAIKGIVDELENLDLSDVNIDEEVYNQFFQDILNTFNDIYDYAITFYFDSLYTVIEIGRIHQLHGSDLLAALFNYGLLSYEEFQERITKTGISYKLGALKIFRRGPSEVLQKLGIKTTFDVLLQCKTRKQRKKLEKLLDNPDYNVLWWANIVDLIRIKGITEKFAIDLENVGVDTVKELATRSKESLYATLIKYWSNQPLHRYPTQKEVTDWINNAKNLTPMLEY